MTNSDNTLDGPEHSRSRPDGAPPGDIGTALSGVLDPTTPLFNELAAVHTVIHSTVLDPDAAGPAPELRDDRAGSTTNATDLVGAVSVLDLFTRVKTIEESAGNWNASNTLQVLCEWFIDFGIDINADEVAAARTLHVPASLATLLTSPASGQCDLVIHVRTDSISPLEHARSHIAALVQGLGQDTSAAVFDSDGDQIASFVHPADDAAH